MDVDPLLVQISQPSLFNLEDTQSGTLELFPALWAAAEALTSPDIEARKDGLERIVAMKAARLSPLVTYLLATRLQDPDPAFRVEVVRVLGDIARPDAQGQLAPEAVRQALKAYLSQMRTRPIFALLQVTQSSPENEPQVSALLNICTFAGKHLIEIVLERSMPLEIRRLATHYIGLVGYLDAIPGLERLLARLEVRQNGQQAMPFLPQNDNDEVALIPAVRAALDMLRAP
jgi:HEAT repeat protein